MVHDKQSSVGAAVSSSSDSSCEVNSEQTLALHFTGDGRELTVNAYGKSGGPLSVMVRYAEKK